MPVVEVAGPADTAAQWSMQPWSSRHIEGTFAKDFCLLIQLTRKQRPRWKTASLCPLHLCCLYFGSGSCLNRRGLLIAQGGSFFLSDPLTPLRLEAPNRQVIVLKRQSPLFQEEQSPEDKPPPVKYNLSLMGRGLYPEVSHTVLRTNLSSPAIRTYGMVGLEELETRQWWAESHSE